MTVAELAPVLAGSFLGSAHCLGMCGGFAAAVGATDRPFWPVLARQLAYSGGRIVSYTFMGALAGAAGARLSAYHVGGVSLQSAVALVAGVLMIVTGLNVAGLWPGSGRWVASAGAWFAPLFAYFLNARGWAGYVVAGMANGFVPCGLVYAFVATAAASGTAANGMMVMAVFGLGTLPAMLVVGCGTNLLGRAARVRLMRLAAVVVIAMGGTTIYRALASGAGSCCVEHAAGDGRADALARTAGQPSPAQQR